MKKLFLTVLLCISSSITMAEISASLSSNKISMGEVASLTITEKNSSGALDLSNSIDLTPLENNFHITSSNKSVKSIIINGNMSATNELTIGLSPKKDGNLEIPPLDVGGKKTEKLILEVSPASSTYKQIGSNSEIFVKATIDDETPYENAQVIYILRAYVPDNFRVVNGKFGKLTSDDAIIEPMNKVTNFESKINNIRYKVFEGRYVIFPKKSGKIKIDNEGVSFIIAEPQTASKNSHIPNMFGMAAIQKEIFLKQDVVTLVAKKKPKKYDNSVWLPAQSISAAFSFPNNSTSFKTGEPIDISITLKAVGLLEQQLPNLQLPPVDGLKVYAGEVKKENTFKDNANSYKTVSFAIIPVKSGDFIIPKLSIPWYNTLTNTNEVLEIPEIKINAVGEGTTTPDAPTSPDAPKTEQPLNNAEEHKVTTDTKENASEKQSNIVLISIGLAGGIVLCAIVAALFIAMKKNSNVPVKNQYKKDLKLIKSACELSNPRLIQEALLNWAQNNIDSKINSVIKIATVLNDDKLKELLEKLTQNIYSNDTLKFDAIEIFKALEVALDANKKTGEANKKEKIPKLYPF